MSKYKNEPTYVDGIRFPSKKEARRYQELRWMQRAGQITDLQRQVPFNLVPSQKTPRGKTIQGVKYIADFVYKHRGMTVVEDAKGVKTQGYIIKKKLMLWIHGIEIQEV